MRPTPVHPIQLVLLVLAMEAAVVVRARPGSRHSRQDLRMLPANATGTPQDQALASGEVPHEDDAAFGQDSVSSTLSSAQQSKDVFRKISQSSTTSSLTSSLAAATVATLVFTPSHGQDRSKGHSGVPVDYAGEDSNIVFPSPPVKVDLGPTDHKFDPFTRAPGGRAPACAKGSTFCTDVDHYPENYLQTMLRSASVGLGYREYFGNDVIAEGNITQRIDATDDNPLCPYEESVVYPKVAKNKDEKWLYVVNQDRFVQGVRIETCLNQDTPCQWADNFPYGYTTSCKQKYILRKLVALNPEGQTQTDMFRLPSCCSCYVSRSTVSSRRGGMTPVIKKSGNRKR